MTEQTATEIIASNVRHRQAERAADLTRQEQNIVTLFRAIDDNKMTIEQRVSLHNYMIGALSMHVPADVWDDILKSAVRCAKMVTGSKVTL